MTQEHSEGQIRYRIRREPMALPPYVHFVYEELGVPNTQQAQPAELTPTQTEQAEQAEPAKEVVLLDLERQVEG